MRNRINSIKYEIRNRNITVFLIPYSGQVRNRNDWNYINSMRVTMTLVR